MSRWWGSGKPLAKGEATVNTRRAPLLGASPAFGASPSVPNGRRSQVPICCLRHVIPESCSQGLMAEKNVGRAL